MTDRTALAVGVLSIVVAGALLVGAAGLGARLWFQGRLTVETVLAESVDEGEIVQLTVLIGNPGARMVELKDIDIAEEFLRGFRLVDVRPAPRTTFTDPSIQARTFSFDSGIEPGVVEPFVFTFVAEDAGEYEGDLDVWDRRGWTTVRLATRVGAPGPARGRVPPPDPEDSPSRTERVSPPFVQSL